MRLPTIEIVVVCFENPEELSRTLQSVGRARTSQYRLIVVDGSQTTRCCHVAERFLTAGDKVVRGRDDGPYDAMNKGAFAGSGDYLWFLNSGDAVHESACLRTVQNCLIESAELASFPVTIRSADGEALETTVRTEGGLRIAMGPHQGMFFRRSSFLTVGGYDTRYRYIADYDLVLRLIGAGCRVSTFQEPVAEFYLGGMSSSIGKRREELLYRRPKTWRGRLLNRLRLWSLRLQ